ncbi:MAG: CheR family methyltransferase [Candidatus Anammoxibacter sp.]
MPRSAIDTGLADYILPVEKMAKELIKYVKHPYIKDPKKILTAEEKFKDSLQKIFVLIRASTGHDFSGYKQNTVRRRIERRMAVHQINKLADYVRFIRQTPVEVDTLYKDMLIGVTNFFRDKDAFDALNEKVIKDILKGKKQDSPIRIWVSGCATGEEAYSIAMLFIEATEKIKKHFNIQIFATDIDANAIEFARGAIYPDSIAADVSVERLEHFFMKEDNAFKVKKQIREMVIFATQNLIKDPAFSKLDLVCCRNVLIYMDTTLQKKIIPLFHYTLNQNGYLYLGTSESIGEFSAYFSPIDVKWKIFKRKGATKERPDGLHRIPFVDTSVGIRKADKRVLTDSNIREIAEKVILEDYAPPSVLINDKYDILYFYGKTEKFLTPPTGDASFNITKMARSDLQYKMTTALHKAVKQRKEIVIEGLKIKHNGSFLNFNLVVRPITETPFAHGLIMVIFEDKTDHVTVTKRLRKAPTPDNTDSQIIVLEHELLSAKEYLQSTTEELETSNEELKSTNEELETSKEELQSTNEELETVNSELQDKVNALSRSNDGLNNLFESTEIGTIFLDTKLCIKRFTPTIADIFNLIQVDIGRPISDINAKIIYQELNKDAEDVLRTLKQKEIEIQSKDNKWYSMRIMPYRTVENMIDGVVITFVDITKLKQVENIRRLSNVIVTSKDAIIVQDMIGTITVWNNSAVKMYGYAESEALGMNISQIIPEDLRNKHCNMIRDFIKGKLIGQCQTKRLTKNGKVLDVCIRMTKLVNLEGDVVAMATYERNITKKKDKKLLIEEYKKGINRLTTLIS